MTLLELVIGIGIAIILISIVFPKDKIGKYNVDSFARQLVSDIRYVRSVNMNGNKDFFIEYIKSSDTSSYVIKDNPNIIKEVTLPIGSQISCVSNIIKFKSDGTLNTKGETIAIIHENKKIEITIVPFSGRVLLKEGKYES